MHELYILPKATLHDIDTIQSTGSYSAGLGQAKLTRALFSSTSSWLTDEVNFLCLSMQRSIRHLSVPCRSRNSHMVQGNGCPHYLPGPLGIHERCSVTLCFCKAHVNRFPHPVQMACPYMQGSILCQQLMRTGTIIDYWSAVIFVLTRLSLRFSYWQETSLKGQLADEDCSSVDC